MDGKYEIWVSMRGKHTPGSVSNHALFSVVSTLDDARSLCYNYNATNGRTIAYYRMYEEPTYAINVEIPAGLLADRIVDTIFEVAYNIESANKLLKVYTEKHTKHSTGCEVSIIEVDEYVYRRNCKVGNTEQTYEECMNSYMQIPAEDELEPGEIRGGGDDVSSDDNGSDVSSDNGGDNGSSDDGNNSGDVDTNGNSVHNRELQHRLMGAIVGQYLRYIRAGNINEFLRAMEISQADLERFIIDYLVYAVGISIITLS